MIRNLFLISAFLLAFGSISQGQNFWKKSESKINEKEIIANKVEVAKFDVYSLDYTNFCQALKAAPMRGAINDGKQLIISFPNPDGGFDRYSVVEAPVMHPDLAANYPGMYSYAAQGIDNKLKSIRFSVSYQRGLYGMIFDEDNGTNFIDPYTTDFSNYMVYRKKDMIRTAADDFECSLTGEPVHASDEKITTPKATNDSKLRTYRLALSCNAEYGNLFIGTATTAAQKIANILAQMNITMTRVNGVYEKDLAITMVIIPNNNLIMYYGTVSADPWSGEFNIKTAQTIDAAIGIANYDIGHNFNTSGGGNAGCIGCVCMGAATSAYYTTNSMHKGKGMTGRPNPTGDAFDIDYVAHEMGHQFGGYHTMNTNCRSAINTTEVEPCSGSTIMSYAGICAPDVQMNSDDYFAYVNIRDISANIQPGGNSNSCAQVTTLTNLPPTANAGLDYTIPKGTAFVLTGSGTDPNGDPLTYTWEQCDVAQASTNTSPSATWTVGPNFRSIKGTSDPKRYFPVITSIIANNLTPTWEVIPNVARIFNFSLLVRDNVITGGQTANDLMKVTVNATAGPFTVSTPNTAVTWAAGSTQTVTWAVAGTTAAPVSCANVDIFLSTDGGYTYPTTLLAGTANSGTATITVPNIPSTTCRVMVRGANNIFFDISNANFTITGTASPIISTSTITTTTYCAGAAVSVPYTISGASFTAGNIFTAQLSNSAGSFATPVAIGTLTSTTAGTISATIPAGTAAGTGYRIRVIGSTPATTGTDNGANITVNAVVTPAISIAASATTICAGTSVTFTPTPTNGGTPTYQWKVNGANVGTGATYTSTTLATGNIVTCVMTSTAACPSTPTATSNSVTMTVNPTVTPAISIAASASTICSGTSVTFTPTPVNGGTPTYQWKVNGVNSGTGATYTSTTLTNGSIVTCVMTSTATCPSTPTATSNAVTMTVNPTVTPAISIAASATSICNGTSVTFTPTPTNGGTPTYQWKVNGVNSGTGATFTSTTLANGSIVTCVMTSTATCLSTPTATSNSITMTVSSPVTPSVNIAASASTICSGTSVTFTPTPVNGGTPTYQWKVNGVNVGTASTFTSTTLNNSDIVTCVMTSTAACVTAPTATSNSVTMTVNPTVSPAITIAATNSTICSGTSVTFTPTPVNGGTPTYQWKVNGVNVGTASTYTSTTLNNSDIVTCVMTSTAACLTASTATSNSITMTVNPTVTPSVSISASATSICTGTSVTFIPTPTNGGTPTYQWKVNGVNSGTGATFTSGTLNNGDLVTCVMTSTALCTASSTANSNTIAMSVLGPVAPSVIIAASANSICSGTSVTFTPTPTNGGTPTYQWTVNAINVGSGSTYTNSGLNNGDVVSCIMTSSLTCATSSTATSNSVNMTVNPTVTPSISISASANSICSGTNVTFTPTPINGGSPTYQWLLNGVNSGNGATYSNSSLANNDVVSCVMTSNATCATTNTANSNSISMTVNTTAIPSVIVSASATSICVGTPILFNAAPTNGGTPTYEWFLNGISVGTGSSYSNSAIADNDVINCIMTSSLSCTTSPTATSNSVAITVHPTPVTPVITQTGFTMYSDYANGNQWYFANLGAPIGGGTNQSYTAIVSGSYYVIVTDQFGCVSDTSNTIVILFTGIENLSENGFSIYPNPTDGNFIVQLNSNTEKAKIELFDAIGQIVFIKELNNSNKFECNLNNLATGVYSIRITTSKSSTTQKIVIQK